MRGKRFVLALGLCGCLLVSEVSNGVSIGEISSDGSLDLSENFKGARIKKVTLKVKKKKTLRYQALKGKIKCRVSKKGIIRVLKKGRKSSVIRGVSVGSTRLTISASGKKVVFKVRVKSAGNGSDSQNPGYSSPVATVSPSAITEIRMPVSTFNPDLVSSLISPDNSGSNNASSTANPGDSNGTNPGDASSTANPGDSSGTNTGDTSSTASPDDGNNGDVESTANPDSTIKPDDGENGGDAGSTANPESTVNPSEENDPSNTSEPEGNQPSEATLNYNAGEYSIKNVHTGDGTFYDRVSGGAANLDDYESIYYTAAMNNEDYMNGLAGAYIEITDKDGDVIDVLITDRLPEGAKGDIDLTRKSFNVIEPEVTGRMDISWKIIPLPTSDPISYLFKPTSSQYWAEVQVRNHRYPIAKLEYKDASGNYKELERQEYNYFTASSGMGTGPFTFRVTDIYGHVLIDEGINLDTSSKPVAGAANFPY
ncbi:MAG: hypothetical protein K6F77_01155 [Lachnospiraceae bacterium]|nr:hypothetical protein [Lachnospiraceae bacterium]